VNDEIIILKTWGSWADEKPSDGEQMEEIKTFVNFDYIDDHIVYKYFTSVAAAKELYEKLKRANNIIK
jgi:hypothetical protein